TTPRPERPLHSGSSFDKANLNKTSLRLRHGRWVAAAACVVAVSLGLPPPAFAQLGTVVYVTGLSSPIELVQDPTDPTVQYVVEQTGRIRTIRSGALDPTPFLDWSA